MDTKIKRCIVCGMKADPELKLEFEGEEYYFHTCLCKVTFEIQTEKIAAERKRLLEDIRNQRSFSHPSLSQIRSPHSRLL